jgi:hypothetical protein
MWLGAPFKPIMPKYKPVGKSVLNVPSVVLVGPPSPLAGC